MTFIEETKRRGLGRGLNSLIPEDVVNIAKTVQNIPIEKLRPGRYQPRRHFDQDAIDDLVESIRQKGILQPLLVRQLPEDDGQYEIIAGERRWRAAQAVMMHDVPVIVRDFSDVETLEIALIENLQREDLGPLEEAEGYKRLQEEFSHTQEQLAQTVGKSRSHIANMIRLLSLPPKVRLLLDGGKISAGHARALLSLDDPEAIANEIVEKGLSVRQTEALVQSGNGVRSRRKSSSNSAVAQRKDADILALEQNMAEILGLKVTIAGKGSGGEVIIKYNTLEQLDHVLDRLSGGLG